MRAAIRTSALLPLLLVAACDGREESAIDNLANGANAAQVENNVRAEAMALMEPLSPPAPGTPGGLPVDPAPVAEGSIDPDSAQGAAQVVQGYYGLLEEKRFEDAQELWNPATAIGAREKQKRRRAAAQALNAGAQQTKVNPAIFPCDLRCARLENCYRVSRECYG